MSLLGGPAEPAVLPQDPDTPAERPAGRLLAVEAGRPVLVRHKDGEANEAAHLVHPARMQQKDMLYTTHKGKKRLAEIQP
jgi:hypothetical protein